MNTTSKGNKILKIEKGIVFFVIPYKNQELIGTVSEIDIQWILNHKWTVSFNRKENSFKTVSSGMRHRTDRTKFTREKLYRLILNVTDSQVYVDHINGDIFDNTRSNLRLCGPLGNAQNAAKRKDNTSGFKGVAWHKVTQKWSAIITVNKKTKWLGLFESKEDAANAYQKAAVEAFGEFYRRTG